MQNCNQRLIESDPKMLKSFNASAKLHQQLSKDYKRQDSNSVTKATIFAMTGKDIVKQARLEKEIASLQGGGANKTQMAMQSEIAALSNYGEPQSREQTKLLIARQKESRRDRHILSCKEFEKWETRLTKNLDEAYKDIKRDVIGFFEESDQKINEYYASLTDPSLLKCEVDFLEELNKIILQHKLSREAKVSNLGERLEELECDRSKSLTFFCDKLQAQLCDTAFQLEPEVKSLVQVHRNQFQEAIDEKRTSNAVYVQEVNQRLCECHPQYNRQADTFIRYEEMRNQSEQRWRDLKHGLYVAQFVADIKQLNFVNPPQRVQLYEAFKVTQVQIYGDRMSFIERLSGIEVGVMNVIYRTPALSKISVERWIEETKQYNDRASQKIDDNFDNLVKESEQTNSLAMQRYQLLSQGLYYACAKAPDALKQDLEELFLPSVTSLFDAARELMKAAVKHLEEADQKQTSVVQNFGAFYLKLGIKNDEYRRDVQQLKHTYEIEKATAADKNDESVEALQEHFTQLKVQLSEALHHPKLQSVLAVTHTKLDELEGVYRHFHDTNVNIASAHPSTILKQHEAFERNIVGVFSLVGEQERAALEAVQLRRAEVSIKKLMAKEDYLKRLEEERATEEAKNKKGGKAPPAAKPKDPKKAAQELDDRFKELMKKVGAEAVPEVVSHLQQKYCVQLTSQEIVESTYLITIITNTEMYISQEEQELLAEQQLKAHHQKQQDDLQQQQQKLDPKAKVAATVAPAIELPIYTPEMDVAPPTVDCKVPSPLDAQGRAVLTGDVVFECAFLVRLVVHTQAKVLEYVRTTLDSLQRQEQIQNDAYIEASLHQRDDKLKAHEPLKAKVEVDVVQLRALQITQHKKKYERYAKSTLEKIEVQTEQFNFYLESALFDMKDYEKQQRMLKESLSSANTLAKFQGIQNTVKENYFKFGEKINEVKTKLSQLSDEELDQVAQRNLDFIRQSKLIAEGGQYSPDEIEWYVDMMKELDTLVTHSKSARQSKIEDLSKLLGAKKQEHLDAFEKEYAMSVEELAAKDGTGKKYGRPKRLAQERLRTEMTKCEKAQEAINAKLKQLRSKYEEYTLHKTDRAYFASQRILMSLLTCTKRYALHIEALKADAKVQDMPRVCYSEVKFDTVIEADQLEQDKKYIEDDLESMGPLYFQKDQRRFVEWVNDIEKVIKDEAQKIYSGDKSKYLNGVDKIPDYLRSYIENMRRNMDDFRIQSIRDLRNSCDEFSEFVPTINEILFGSMELKFTYKLNNSHDMLIQEFNTKRAHMETIKELHQTKLKPNLSNPQCKGEFDALCQAEKSRLEGWMQEMQSSRAQLLNQEFQDGCEFFKCIAQNFEFTLLYYDAIVLFEDFVKLPGDEQIAKKHQNLKTSLRQKQSGAIIDTSSERALTKEWEGVPIDSFNLEELKVVYVWQPNIAVQVDTKDAKKKDDKKPAKIEKKKEQVEQSDLSLTHTKSLKSFKTHRQKSSHHHYEHSFSDYHSQYTKKVIDTQQLFKRYLEREMKFEFKWEQNVVSLFAVEQ